MTENLLHTIYLALAFLTLFASAEVLYTKFKVKAEITRKYVHIVTGLLTMLFPPLIGNHWLVLLLCGSFLLILLTSLALNLLPSINAVKRKTSGSILYPIIVYGCYLAYISTGHFKFYYIPILILALCDPIAALVGKSKPIGKYVTFGYQKSLSGSFGFFVSAIITSVLLLVNLEDMAFKPAFVTAILVAFVTTIAEALTHKGFDNLTIPGSAMVVLWLLELYPTF